MKKSYSFYKKSVQTNSGSSLTIKPIFANDKYGAIEKAKIMLTIIPIKEGKMSLSEKEDIMLSINEVYQILSTDINLRNISFYHSSQKAEKIIEIFKQKEQDQEIKSNGCCLRIINNTSKTKHFFRFSEEEYKYFKYLLDKFVFLIFCK